MMFVLALKAMAARPWRHPFRAPARKIDCSRSVKKPCIQRTYSANLRIRRCFGTMSRAVVPGAAERCGRAFPGERKALPAGRRSRPLRRRAASGSEPKRVLATRQPRAVARASCAPRVEVLGSGRQLGRRRILGWLAGGRRGAAWPLMHSAPADWRPTRRCLASDGTRRWLAGDRPTRRWLASDGKHTRTQTSRTPHDEPVPRRSRKDGPSRRLPGADRAGRGPRGAGSAPRVDGIEGGGRGVAQGHERRCSGRRPHARGGPLGPDRLQQTPREHPGLGARRRRAVAAVDARGRDQARPRTLRRPSPFPSTPSTHHQRRSRCSRSRARSSSRTACTSTAS